MFSDQLTRRELLKSLAMAMGGAVIVDAIIPGISEARNSSPNTMAARDEDLVSLVNPLQGTNSNFGFSRGNTLPLIALPFGMTHWSPQTSVGSGWFFDPNAHNLQGIRATHQPSPWMGDYGHFTVMAQTGTADYDPATRAVAYDPAELHVGPHSLSVALKNGTTIELTPTERCAAFRFTFPAGETGRVMIDAHSHVEIDAAAGVVTGCSRLKGFGAPDNFGCYFYATFDKPFSTAVAFDDDFKPVAGHVAEGKDAGAAVEFDNARIVVMKVATSFISVDQARRNLEREIGDRTFDSVRSEASKTWNETLGIVRIAGGIDRERRTFYSCLYRAHLFPRMFHEYDDAGKAIHYSAFDSKLHDGVMYTDTGLWDGYHTLYPLLSLLQPARLGEIVQGFVNAYHEGGWLPQWPNPGYHGTMGGTHSDVVIAGAILKNIAGFDREAAYDAIRKDATVDPSGSTEGRHHLADYLRLGYIPEAVSESLDYAYDDACVGLAAKALGHGDDAELFNRRALNYRNVYDKSVGFMRSRKADGTWKENFDQYAWGEAYTEGGPWQWSFAVPHDPAGLMELMGGRDAFLRKLDRMLWQPPTFHVGGYGGEIHEMKEMAAVPFGQYAQSNQPVHQVLPLYAAAGAPAKMHYWSRRVLDELYSPDNFPGDEDNGEMASWYVLMALGLFPHCPGRPSFVFSSPLFRDAWVKLPGGKTLHLHAQGNSPQNVFANSVMRNGQEHSALVISYADIMRGGRLEFTMEDRPRHRELSASDLPESLSAYSADSITSSAFFTKVAINCGGDEIGEFIRDYYVEGGESITIAADDLAPSYAASARQGSFTYRIPLPKTTDNRGYKVDLHFPAGGRQDVLINGQTAIADLNLENAGQPVLRGFVAQPKDDGQIVIEVKAARGAATGGRLSAIVVTG
jgi:predicted alpha-1,2-mannosidase